MRLGCVGDIAVQSGLQAFAYGGRQGGVYPVLFDNGPGIGPGAFVGDGGAAGDHVQGAADDVAEGKSQEGSGRCGAGQLAALHGAGVFAEAVHFVDGCATGQEGVGHALHVGQGERRKRLAGVGGRLVCRRHQQGGSATGEQSDYQVVGGRLFDEGKHLFAGEDAGFIGNRMTCLHDADTGGHCGGRVGGVGMVILCHGQSAVDTVLEHSFDSAAHRCSCLAGSDDEDAAVAGEVVCQRGRCLGVRRVGDSQDFALTLEDVLHGGKGVNGIEGGVEDGQDGAAGRRVGSEDGFVEAGHAVFFRFSGKNRFNSSTRI